MSARFARNLKLEQMAEWAELTSDYNPMHLDPEFTRQTPYGRPIVYATLTLAMVSEALEHKFGSQWIEGGTLDVRFVEPVFVGEDFSVSIDQAGCNIEISCESAGKEPLKLTLTLARDKAS